MYLSRSQLYELVWSKPITSLAKEYGFSDVGFSKICRRHNIPLPPRGYWARVGAGLKISKPELPHPHRDDSVYIPPRTAITDDEILRKKRQLDKVKSEIEQIGNITVPDQISSPHKFTKNTRLYFEKLIKKIETAKKSKSIPNNYLSIINSVYRGRLVCHQSNCFDTSVSEALVNRAISFLDVLVKELESRGFKLKSVDDEKAGDYVVVIESDEYISFKISEGYKYEVIKKAPNELSELERLLYSDKKPIPTGILTFSVYARETKIGKNWTDGKRLIETELPAIINEFINLVPRQKQLRIDAEVRAEQRKEEARLLNERESKRYFEKSIYDEAMKEAQIFKAHQELEAYLNHLGELFLEKNDSFTEQAIAWFSTVRKVALVQSPIDRRLERLGLH